MILTWVLGSLFLISLGLLLWQTMAAFQFPVHRRRPPLPITTLPPVTLFKPLKGRDPETRRCLETWFEQTYAPGMQLLLGVDSENDPAAALARELIESHPDIPARLIVCSPHRFSNGKVAKLVELSQHARHDVWVVSDADVAAPPDFLEQTVSLLLKEKAGLIHSLYRLTCPPTVPMQWEAVGVNVDFWSQVLQARQLQPLDFALGAALVTSRRHMASVGGFAAFGDYLADDYHLGHELARQGHRLILSSVVVECREPPASFHQVWQHQLRWARTIRSCKPWPYFFSLLNNVTLWTLSLGFLAPPFPGGGIEVAGRTLGWIVPLCLASLGLRTGLGLALHRRLTGRPLPWRWWGMMALKDILQAAVWGMAFLGSRVDWRGEKYRVHQDGRMVACEEPLAEEGGGLPAYLDSSTQPGKRR